MARRKNATTGLVNVAPPPIAPYRRCYREFTLNLLYLAANRMPPAQVAGIMGISLKRTEFILSCARAKKEIAEISFNISGQSPEEAFNRLVPETIQVQADIMRDKREKGAVRIMAANAIQDRALGKPKQQVDIHHKSSVRQVLELLNAEKDGKAIPAEHRPVSTGPALTDPNEVPLDFPETPPVDSLELAGEPRDEVDDWINKNL